MLPLSPKFHLSQGSRGSALQHMIPHARDLAAEPNRIAPPITAGALAELRGIGGTLLLTRDSVRLERHGIFFSLLNIAWHVEREIATTIHLRDLVAVHLVRSFTLVQFLRFTYAGCPQATGHYLRDAFAENAYMHSMNDNRPLLAFMRQVEAAIKGLQ